jgi:hypothetical protein
MTETIVVEMNGKFGPKVGGVFYSFGKFFKGDKQLPIGVPISVDVYVADSGKKYINRLEGSVAVSEAPITVSHTPPPFKPLNQVTDWAAKDRSQLVGGRSHDAAELVNTALVTGTPLEEVLKLYKEALQAILKMSEEVK